jgi:hypothetical protein
MARVGCWLPLLLFVYILWQAYRSSKLEDEILVLRREKTRHGASLRAQISYWKRKNVRIAVKTQQRMSDGLTFCEQ